VVDDINSYSLNSIGDMVLQYKADDMQRRIVLLDQDLLGDFDHDDDVDLDDFETFLLCMLGPGDPSAPGCEETDFDDDGDVDLDDFAVMQEAFVECEQDSADCNGNGVGDDCEIEGFVATDCDENGTLDECDIAYGGAADCNGNWLPDSCDLDSGLSDDYNLNGIPDECEDLPDCNHNGIWDVADISEGTSEDCDEDEIPDECELWSGPLRLIAGFGDPSIGIVHLEPSDGTLIELFDSGDLIFKGLANTCDGRVYGLAETGEVAEIDPDTGEVTLISDTTYYNWSAAAFDCAEQILYGSVSDGAGLFNISTADGSVELIGGQGYEGMAFDSDNAILYGGIGSGLLWTADPATGWPTLLCDNLDIWGASNLAFADGLLYTLSWTDNLYQINPDTCEVVLIGPIIPGLNGALSLCAWQESTDCNENFIPDNCDIADGTSEDLDGDGVPDECEEPDCNENGIPDSEELIIAVAHESPQYSPFGHGYPATYTMPASLPSLTDVMFTFEAIADLGSSHETVHAQLEGFGGTMLFGTSLGFAGINCPETPSIAIKTKSAWNFNRTARGMAADITMQASDTVDAFECPQGTFISVAVEYLGDNDCDADGVPDDCQPTEDCNGDGWWDVCDLLYGVSEDCNANDSPDECDIASGASQDCDQNGVPDECQPDCNENGVADVCDIADGTSQDCNENGIPDECDIADGTSSDLNGNGIPDECEGFHAGFFWVDYGSEEIERALPDGTGREVIITSAESARDLDVHEVASKVYWARSDAGGNIYRASIDGSDEELVLPSVGSAVRGLAINDVNERMYWTISMSGTGGHISSANLEGTDVQAVVSGLDEPFAVAVDGSGGKIYWVDQDQKVIRRANLDGSGIEDLVTSTIAINRLALDPADDRMYWTQASDGTIHRARLDGADEETIVTSSGSPGGITLDFLCGKVYWSEGSANLIRRANLDGSVIEDLITGDMNGPGALAFYDSSQDPSRCVEDCNDNGIPDDQDIEEGTSQDCNQNGIPDECDIADGTSEDCNENGVPDSCDIAEGTSEDVNGNGIPDECEGTLDPALTFTYTLILQDPSSPGGLNNLGHVVYSGDDGIVLWSGGGTTLKASFSDFDGLGSDVTLLNDNGQIVVYGRRSSSNFWEILRIEPEQTADDVAAFTLIADSSGYPFSNFQTIGPLVNSGAVAFQAESPIFNTTYVGDGTGSVHDPASFLQPFPSSLFSEPVYNAGAAMNDNGLVVEVVGGQTVVGLVGDLPPTPGYDDYVFFSEPSDGYVVWSRIVANNNHKVAFRHNSDPKQLVLSDGTEQQVLADYAMTTGGIAINDFDEVAFLRETSGRLGKQLLLTDGLYEVTVISDLDEIDGIDVEFIDIGSQAYNNARQVLFRIRYQDPPGTIKYRLYLANPVTP
jgi:sugar lactone lactonase YvrE